MNFIGQVKVLLFVKIIVATWLIVRAILALVPLVITLYNSSFDVIYSSSDLIILSSLLSGGAFLGTAIGILKSKRWAVYAFIGITLLSFVSQFVYGTFQIDFGEVAFDFFNIFLIFYLWQNRDKFEVGDKKKEDTFLGLSVLAFAVSIILSGFLADKLNKFLDEQTQLPGTLNWQTYRNEAFGFEMKYPPENVLVEVLSGGVSFLRKDRPCDFIPVHKCPTFMWVTSYTGVYGSTERFLADRYGLEEFQVFSVAQHDAVGGFSVDMIQSVQFGEDKKKGFLVHNWAQATGDCIYYAKQGTHILAVSRHAVGLLANECSADPLFNQVLSTFRFVEESEAE